MTGWFAVAVVPFIRSITHLRRLGTSAVSVATVLSGQPNDPRHKTRFIIWNMAIASLSVPMLPQYKTCPAFAQPITAKNTSNALDLSKL